MFSKDEKMVLLAAVSTMIDIYTREGETETKMYDQLMLIKGKLVKELKGGKI